MANRKRPIVLRCPVTAEERALIEQKMAQLPTQRIGAYLRKMAIDGYVIYADTADIKAFTKELSAIEDQLGVEQTLVKKFALYAQMTTDPQLKTQFEQNSAKHQNHYDRLLQQLG